MAPPFWAFAWPGSEALARYITDHPGLVRGKRVLDFAAGCGLAGLACLRAGAAQVQAAEIDPLACAAMRLNAAANHWRWMSCLGTLLASLATGMSFLCGDVRYEAAMTAPHPALAAGMRGAAPRLSSPTRGANTAPREARISLKMSWCRRA